MIAIAPKEQLTVLSFGGGQDSTAILYRLHYDAEFRARYAPGRLLIIMACTGDEHPRTKVHILNIMAFCDRHGYEFVHLTSDMGFHNDSWQSLRGFYNLKHTIGSKAFPKTCTDQLKIQPIYRFLSHWVATEYEFDRDGKYRGKTPLGVFAGAYSKINVLIGIAKGEEGRLSDDASGPVWMQLAISKKYPLIDYGMDRAACQCYIVDQGHICPPPSNCMLCPFMSLQELLWLYLKYPEDFADWVRMERNKIEKNKHMGDRNLGVWGKKLLPQVLEEAKRRFGHMTLAQLEEYKFSHGHCVKSKY